VPATAVHAEPGVRPALTAAVLSGAAVALQQQVNGQLKSSLGSALLAAVVSFSAGLVCVLAVVLARPGARAAWPSVRQVPLWHRLGGLGGASLVAVGATAAPKLGVALLTVGLVAGTTTGGLVVDRGGLGPGGRRSLTAPRVCGALLCLLAVAISVQGAGVRAAAPLLLVLVVAAGFATSVQQALNGRVRAVTRDASVATLVNFLVGTTALALALAVSAALSGLAPVTWPDLGHWYLYLGGPLGAAFVAIAAVVVRVLGVLRLGLAVTAGQLVGAVLLDLAFPAAGTSLALATVVGAALTLVAVAVSGRGA